MWIRSGRSKSAIITHGHADHARAGHGAVLATRADAGHHGDPLRQRLSAARPRTIGYGEHAQSSAASTVSLHPAGHVLGSAQVLLARHRVQRTVVSGDYKRQADPTCAFRSSRCPATRS
jgi:putative mRNA 3-end processing factor